MNNKELQEHLAQSPDNAKILVVVNNYPVEFQIAWSCDDGGSKATAKAVCLIVNSNNEVGDETDS